MLKVGKVGKFETSKKLASSKEEVVPVIGIPAALFKTSGGPTGPSTLPNTKSKLERESMRNPISMANPSVLHNN